VDKLRLLPFHIEGTAPSSGNRNFKLSLQNNQILFKPCKRGPNSITIALTLPNIKKNYQDKLNQLEELTKNKEIPFTVGLTDEHISISFELDECKRLESIVKRPWTKNEVRFKAKDKLESLKQKTNKNEKRVLGLDLNPNYIGVSVIQFNEDDDFKVLYKEVIDFKELNNKKDYSANKKKHETIEVAKHVSKLAVHWNCAKLAVEDLTINASNKGLGKWFNRLCNNVWHRDLLMKQLEKRCIWTKIELVKINAAYSSTVGNVSYGDENTPDMVASSIEVARRVYKKFTKGWFYPELKNAKNLQTLWKDDVDRSSLNWKEIHQEIKKSGVKYRFQLEDSIPEAVFRFKTSKSKLRLNVFTNVYN